MISIAALIMPGNAHRDHDVDQLEAEEPAQLLRLPGHDPVLGQRRVQEDHVRHHRRAEDADRQQHALGPVELRRDRARADRAPVGIADERLDQVADRDHADHAR